MLATEVRRWVKIILWGMLLGLVASLTPASFWIFLVAVPIAWYGGKAVLRQNRIDDEFQRIIEAEFAERDVD